jgi:hypothetical protein
MWPWDLNVVGIVIDGLIPIHTGTPPRKLVDMSTLLWLARYQQQH